MVIIKPVKYLPYRAIYSLGPYQARNSAWRSPNAMRRMPIGRCNGILYVGVRELAMMPAPALRARLRLLAFWPDFSRMGRMWGL